MEEMVTQRSVLSVPDVHLLSPLFSHQLQYLNVESVLSLCPLPQVTFALFFACPDCWNQRESSLRHNFASGGSSVGSE